MKCTSSFFQSNQHGSSEYKAGGGQQWDNLIVLNADGLEKPNYCMSV